MQARFQAVAVSMSSNWSPRIMRAVQTGSFTISERAKPNQLERLVSHTDSAETSKQKKKEKEIARMAASTPPHCPLESCYHPQDATQDRGPAQDFTHTSFNLPTRIQEPGIGMTGCGPD